MGVNKGKGVDKETSGRPKRWFGWHDSGRWYCECNRLASCLTTTKGDNTGRLFWICPKDKNSRDRCRFYTWDDEGEEAKEWLAKNGKQQVPETPTRKGQKGKEPPSPPKNDDTPWTIAKKRKPVSREVSDENEDNDPFVLRNTNCGESSKQGGDPGNIDTSRKAVKITEASTPGKISNEQMHVNAAGLPTPDTGKKQMSEEFLPRSREDSPTPARKPIEAIDLRGEEEEEMISDLTKAVLEVLRSDKVEIKGSTALQIGHEIDMELDQNKAKVKRYKETISTLRKRIDGLEGKVDSLETTVVLLTGGGMDEPLELSD